MPITQLNIFFLAFHEKCLKCLLIKVLERVIVALNQVLYFPLLSLELPSPSMKQHGAQPQVNKMLRNEVFRLLVFPSYCLKTSGNTFDSFVFTDSLF